MKLRAIRLHNVRRFTDPVEIVGIGDGLNVLAAPNERGKSTIFDALHAIFFKDRKSWDKDVRTLAPHAGGDPVVGVDIEVEEKLYRIEKRWTKSRNGDVRIWSGNTLVHQADDAEAWLSTVLKSPRDGGPAGLLWVRQGLTNLDGDGDQGRIARRDLMSSVAGEVEMMTGGRRMEAILQRCNEALRKYLTNTGRPRSDGPLKAQQDLVADLVAREQTLSQSVARLRQELETRRQLRRELEELETPEAVEDRQSRFRAAQKSFEDAERHEALVVRACEQEQAAKLRAERAQERLNAISAAMCELEEAEKGESSARDSADLAAKKFATATSLSEAAEAAFGKHRKAAEFAGAALRSAALAEAARSAVVRRDEIREKIANAERYRAEVEAASTAVGLGLSAGRLEEIERLNRELQAAKRALEADAASVIAEYEPGHSHDMQIDEMPIEAGVRVPIARPVPIRIKGVGHLTVHPGVGVNEDGMAEAEIALRDALRDAGFETIESARASAARRAEAEQQRRAAQSALEATAPKGIEELRKVLAAMPVAEQVSDEIPDLAEAQKRENEARIACDEAEIEREKARTSSAEARASSIAAKTTYDAALARLGRAKEALSAFPDVEKEKQQRASAVAQALAELAEAGKKTQALTEDAPDVEAARAGLDRARSILERAETDRQRLKIELGKLDTTIEHHSGEAVEEELADTEGKLEKARSRLGEIEFEVSVLQKLTGVLTDARAQARDRYVEPVKRELVPLLRLLWEDSELQFDADDVLPTSLVRNGEEEEFSVLSGGTQEQIALLVRLAFARILAASGHSAPVILDDAIVYTDDDRIERIFDALTRQAKDIQILVFSCRQRAFRDLGGHSLTISADDRPGAGT